MGIKHFGAGKPPEKIDVLTQPSASSGVAVTGACVFKGIIFKTDGTNDVTVTVYDNTSASGNKLTPESFVIEGSARVFALSYEPGVLAVNGIYVAMSVAGGGEASFQVKHTQG